MQYDNLNHCSIAKDYTHDMQRTRLAPKFSKSINLMATILSKGLQFASHTCGDITWRDQQCTTIYVA